MTLKLGPKEIKLSRVHKVSRAGHHRAQIHFKTGESIIVVCGVSVPDQMRYTYPGTYQQLAEVIRNEQASRVS